MDLRPRGLRLHQYKKDAVSASSTLDFVTLSACDEGMVLECDKAHQAEALKRRRAARQETNKCQKKIVPCPPPSENLSSEDLASELGQFEMGQIQFPMQKDPRRPQSSRFGESQLGGGSFGESLSSLGVSSSDGTSPRPHLPCRTSDRRVPSSSDCALPFVGQLFVMPRVRSLRLVKDDKTQRADAHSSTSLRSYCPSRTSPCGQTSFEAAHRSLSSISLSGVRPSPGEGEVHEVLVRCPAPKRPRAVPVTIFRGNR